jgi:hypothetical protein
MEDVGRRASTGVERAPGIPGPIRFRNEHAEQGIGEY